MSANNEERNRMQTEAVMNVLEKHRVIVEWGTGTGKSRVAIRTVCALMYAGRHRILLLIAERAHRENWRREFVEALGEDMGNDVFDSLTVECYASLFKYENSDWDVVIADEAHHLRSEARTTNIGSVRADYFLCLSATMSDRNDAAALLKMLDETFGKFVSMKFTLNDAIENRILAKPDIYVHLLDLKNVRGPATAEVAWGWPAAQKEIAVDFEGYKDILAHRKDYPNVKITVTGTAPQCYAVLNSFYNEKKKEYDDLKASLERDPKTIKEYNALEKKTEYAKNRMLQAALQRKNFLGACKTEYAGHVIRDIIGDKKFICFCSSVEQGEALNADTIISSYRTPKANDEIIARFNDGESRSLYAVGMLQEGANLAGIQAGLIVQLDVKERPFVQKFGRAMRSDRPEQHILIFNQSRDVFFMNSALEGIDPKYITYINGATGKPYPRTISKAS